MSSVSVDGMKQPVSFGTTPPTVNGNMATMVDEARRLLDFTQRLDINLLDNVVICMYSGEGAKQQLAQEILTTLKEHPDAWTRVDTILEFSKNQETKYYGLQILETVIKTRWKVLPRTQCDGIKKYIVGLIIKTSSESEMLEREKVYLNKLNMILVQILKREWPKNWPTFVGDIVGASKTNESLCQNNMVILKLLSEEIFDFSSGQMTQTKAKHLKDTMCNEFSQIFQLCNFVMENSQNAPLVQATLETLLRFLVWIPLGYIFETKLISTLIYKFFNVPMFRNVTLQCLTEISNVMFLNPEYGEMLILLFTQTMAQLEQMLPPNTQIKEAYANGQDDEQKFIQNLSMFLSVYLRTRHCLLEQQPYLHEMLITAHKYLLLISEVEEVEIFKICLEYWNNLAATLYRDNPLRCLPEVQLAIKVSREERRLTNKNADVKNTVQWELYGPILSKLRYIMIARMAKPQEVLVVENDQGEVVREFMKDTDSIQLYKNMRETLVYLTHLDYADTERIMTEKLMNQVNGTEFTWKNLNTLCWAIGSISGAMYEEDEKRFLVTVIKDLLGLCEQKRGKDNKAIIASNIMYVVGQYPRFLRAHWKFLKTVVNKLFEFMHETHEGVQDMACDTFIKIAQKCRRYFVHVQAGEVMPFIEEILNSINTIICDLRPHQVHIFYEAIGCMICAQSDEQIKDRLIEKCMLLPNEVWDMLMQQATKSVDILQEDDVIKQLGNILKTNVRVCKSIGMPYVLQLGRIYLDMLNLYKVMSENIIGYIGKHGEQVMKTPKVRAMRTVKKETLKLVSKWIELYRDAQLIVDNFMTPLLDVILVDYHHCTVPAAREPEVLLTLMTIIKQLKTHMIPDIPKIFDAVFECTLDMINKDFEEFPEHRTNFFLLLHQAVECCFPALMSIPPAQFKLVMDSVIWAFKHTMRDVADTGLDILHQVLQNIEEEAAAQSFYQAFYTDIMQHLFSVITDTSHTAGLSTQSEILRYMFILVEENKITVPLNVAEQTATGMDNVAYVQQFVASLLKNAFGHLTDAQIKITVQGFFNLTEIDAEFKEHLRDFLVQIREYAGEDDSDLFLEEREAELKKRQEEKFVARKQVPGILNPHEIQEDMQD